MNRFSKIVSVSTLVPCAMERSAMSWACMSVGKPGWGAVVTSSARSGPVRETTIPSPSRSIDTPV
jgi:hypothetical protein